MAKSTPVQRAPAHRLGMPEHGVIADVGQRMAEGRQLPVEHRDDARLGGVEHDVLEPVVAMRDGRGVFGGHAAGSSSIRRLHRRDLRGLGAAVLFGPAVDLAGEVVARPAVVGEPDRRVVDPVQPRQHRVQLVVDRRPLGRLDSGQPRVAENAAGEEIHHVEGGADHALVEAQGAHLRHREAAVAQRLHHPVFAVDLVGAGEQLSGRLLAQHQLVVAGV